MAMVGLTGGIGSGKSVAARRFATHGFPTVDADSVGHEVIAPGGPAVQPVIDAFGDDILTDGAIDRHKLAAIVFKDDKKRRHLNGLLHPIINRRVAETCAKHIQAGAKAVIIEAALLGEDGHRDPWLDKLIVVDSPVETRIARVTENRGMSREEAEARISMQADPAIKRKVADWVIDNDGTIESLYEQVDAIANELLNT